MTTRRRSTRRSERGTTLLEAMISLALLLIGLLGMARLQIYGMTATQGARAHTIATQLASELGGALSRLPSDDARLTGGRASRRTRLPRRSGRSSRSGSRPASTGGRLLPDPRRAPRLDARARPEPTRRSPIYQRRWTVWDAGVTANGAAAKVIAVSVIYRERTIPAPREVVLYVHSEVRGNFMANINAFN